MELIKKVSWKTKKEIIFKKRSETKWTKQKKILLGNWLNKIEN